MDLEIACVIVTYNRKALLHRCLDAVLKQTFKPKCVYITDNASTDGTIDLVKDSGFYNCIKNGIEFKYIQNSKNEGGAGGFYIGMKTATEDAAYDALWVMDDDGEPKEDCLKHLVPYLNKYDYIAPIVLSDKDHITCSFSESGESLSQFCVEKGVRAGVIDKWASPFNGILYSKRLIKTIGYPKKEMFIWGDERNYDMRAIKYGFVPITIISAIHYHPVNRQVYIPYRWGFVVGETIDWKLYCLIRNTCYNNTRFSSNRFKSVLSCFSLGLLYFLYFKDKQNSNKFSLIFNAVFGGLFGCFGGERKYMKK